MKFWKRDTEEDFELDDDELEILDMFEAIQRDKEERKALERKRAEERAIEAERKRIEDEKRAEEERIAEELRREEEARIAEAERIAEEKRRIEIERRLEEEARLFEEAKKAVEARIAKRVLVGEEKSSSFDEPAAAGVLREEVEVVQITGKSNINNPHLFLGNRDKKFSLGWYEDDGEVDVFFYSRDKQIRAIEFMEFLVSDYGKATGNPTFAEARLTKLWFKVAGVEVTEENVDIFLNMKIDEYFTECDWLYTLGLVDENFLKDMRKFKKRAIPWAYVKTVDILPRGEKFKMKMLENETEVELVSSDDLYIMIGIKGEIYSITKQKFMATYTDTFEEFDLCNMMPIYLPAVHSLVTNKRISLDDKAHVCIPRGDNAIYAKQLERKTKVFTIYNKGEYFVGKPGDFLVVREDDLEDVYIVQKEIFGDSYEKAIDA